MSAHWAGNRVEPRALVRRSIVDAKATSKTRPECNNLFYYIRDGFFIFLANRVSLFGKEGLREI